MSEITRAMFERMKSERDALREAVEKIKQVAAKFDSPYDALQRVRQLASEASNAGVELPTEAGAEVVVSQHGLDGNLVLVTLVGGDELLYWNRKQGQAYTRKEVLAHFTIEGGEVS